jgi:diguanylate cyclase
MGDPAADLQWKDRYRELLRDYETKEREWSKLEAALRSAASRVAVAAMGQSEALDAALGPLVESLRTKGALPQLDTSTTSLMRALKIHEWSTPKEQTPDLPKLLGQLVRSLGRIPGFVDAEAALEERLAAGVPAASWGEFLDDVAREVGAVVERIREQRAELEQFLDEVTRQLTTLEAWTSWQSDAAQTRRDDTRHLERTFETEIGGLIFDVGQSRDLRSLKSKVQTRLDAVAQQLRQFRESEERRNAENEQRSAALSQEVLRLKVRTTELADLCAAQEKRLLIDPLTGVHSRYAYERRLAEEHERWQRYGGSLTYTIWDIDGFKRVNDRFGHEAGDRLLRGVAEIMNRAKRETDFLARIGGEEFVLLLPMTPGDAALAVAEKLRKTIEGTAFTHKGQRELVTISCGLTEFRIGDTPTIAYERADGALYTAKDRGRNRCVAV